MIAHILKPSDVIIEQTHPLLFHLILLICLFGLGSFLLLRLQLISSSRHVFPYKSLFVMFMHFIILCGLIPGFIFICADRLSWQRCVWNKTCSQLWPGGGYKTCWFELNTQATCLIHGSGGRYSQFVNPMCTHDFSYKRVQRVRK